MTDVVTVVVADDNAWFRSGIVRALRRRPGIEVVAEVGDGAEALAAARRLRPRVLVVDDRMPLLDGLGVIRAVSADPDLRAVRVLMLSAGIAEDQTAAAVAAGAVGRIDKDRSRSQICAAIELAGTAPDVLRTARDVAHPDAGHARVGALAESPTAVRARSVREDDGVWQAVARERVRLADALHDGPIQEVATMVQDCDDALDGDEDALTSLRDDLERLGAGLRSVVGGLHEQSLAELTLCESVGQIVRALELDGRLEIALDIDPAVDGYVDPLLRETVRELLTNVAQHAEARMVAVSIALAGPDLEVRVVDDGIGFDPALAKAARERGHLGLQRLERGVARLGGRFRMSAAVPVGTIATVQVPAAGLAHPGGPRQGAPGGLASHDRDGQSAQVIIDAAALRDGVARAEDLTSLARDRAADARDVASESAEPSKLPGGVVAAPSAAPDAGRARASRASAHDDRDHSAGDRERGAVERLLAAADRLALAAQVTIAETDALTGARTRPAGLEDLRREVDRCRRTDQGLVVAYVDVDGLKIVNDVSGHAAGDELLQRVVTTIRERLRSYDLIVRLGGDEFLCAMPGLSKAAAAERFALIATDLRQPPAAAVSVGLARLTEQDTVGLLVGRADQDLIRGRARPHHRRPTDGTGT